jgi:hypothetical protein
MANSDISWIEWQKLVIREDYKDIKIALPVRDKIQQQFEKSVQESLPKVKRND